MDELLKDLATRDFPCDIELAASVARALGHKLVRGQDNYTMRPNYSIAWVAPHSYAGMKEPCPALDQSMDAVFSLINGQFPEWRLAHVGLDDMGFWNADLRIPDGGGTGVVSCKGVVAEGLPMCRAVLIAMFKAMHKLGIAINVSSP